MPPKTPSGTATALRISLMCSILLRRRRDFWLVQPTQKRPSEVARVSYHLRIPIGYIKAIGYSAGHSKANLKPSLTW